MTSFHKKQCETRSELANECLIPWYIIGVTAITCASTLVLIAFLGPIGQEIIQYRTSQSGIWQITGQDLTNLVLIAPILLIGGILCLARRAGSKYLLILTPDNINVYRTFYGDWPGVEQFGLQRQC